MPALQFAEGGSLPPEPLPPRKQLLNNIIDGIAATRPESVWAKVPRDEQSYASGFRKVTYKILANAVNGVARWLVGEIGRSTNFETLAYVGPWDPRYIIILLGAVKAGFKMVFPSPSYPAAGLSQLLQRLGCSKFLVSSKEAPIVSEISHHLSLDIHQVPSLRELLDNEFSHFPYQKTFQSARFEPLMVIHTSGTTGPPKPLVLSHDWAASWIQENQWPAPKGYVSWEHPTHGIELCAIAPPNHSSSFFPNFFGAIANQIVVMYPLPNSGLTIETTMELIRRNDPNMLIAPSFVLDSIAASENLIKEVSSKVGMIGFGGGPLSKQTGDILTRHFRVFGMYGTSEMGVAHKIAPAGPWDAGAWNSMMFHPKDNIEFRKVESSSGFEAVLKRNANYEEEQPVFKLFPDLQEWSTKDIFIADPDREGFWKYEGRIDDIIILNGGQTVNPIAFEQRISNHPQVAAVMMCGIAKPQTALVVQLADLQPDKVSATKDEIRKAIAEANELHPPQARVERSYIIFTAPGKPLPKSAKGTVQRVAARQLYQSEIDALY